MNKKIFESILEDAIEQTRFALRLEKVVVALSCALGVSVLAIIALLIWR